MIGDLISNSKLGKYESMEDDLPFHFSNLLFHSEHLPYSIPKFSFHSIPFSIPFHSLLVGKDKRKHIGLRDVKVILGKLQHKASGC